MPQVTHTPPPPRPAPARRPARARFPPGNGPRGRHPGAAQQRRNHKPHRRQLTAALRPSRPPPQRPRPCRPPASSHPPSSPAVPLRSPPPYCFSSHRPLPETASTVIAANQSSPLGRGRSHSALQAVRRGGRGSALDVGYLCACAPPRSLLGVVVPRGPGGQRRALLHRLETRCLPASPSGLRRYELLPALSLPLQIFRRMAVSPRRGRPPPKRAAGPGLGSAARSRAGCVAAAGEGEAGGSRRIPDARSLPAPAPYWLSSLPLSQSGRILGGVAVESCPLLPRARWLCGDRPQERWRSWWGWGGPAGRSLPAGEGCKPREGGRAARAAPWVGGREGGCATLAD